MLIYQANKIDVVDGDAHFMNTDAPFFSIVEHYENCLKIFGDTHLGVDWRSAEDANKRYKIMLDIINNDESKIFSVLDFGCGTAALLDYINRNNIFNISYTGLDISAAFIKVCKKKYPNINFFNVNILDKNILIPSFDYIILNGVFTEKIKLSHTQMVTYFCSVIEKVFFFCKIGMAFNLRSKQVASESLELFHLSLDDLAWFLVRSFGRCFVIRNDYDLEEYTVYLYKK